MNLINWFPGHMAKALKNIKELKLIIDCFIVMLDARVPLSSYNDEFDKIVPNKPRVFIFSKSDYTNIDKLNKILPKFNNKNDKFVVVNLKQNSSKQKILKILNKILSVKKEKDLKKGLVKSRLRCFVVGMPNVGKSTLINLLSGYKKVKVANFAGTTKNLQWISTNKSIQLLDTPGILMSKLINQKDALKLVACNLIKQEVISDNDFYINILDYIQMFCPEKFKELDIEYHEDENKKYDQLLIYSQKYKIIKKNNQPDINKTLLIIRKKVLNFKNVIWD